MELGVALAPAVARDLHIHLHTSALGGVRAEWSGSRFRASRNSLVPPPHGDADAPA